MQYACCFDRNRKFYTRRAKGKVTTTVTHARKQTHHCKNTTRTPSASDHGAHMHMHTHAPPSITTRLVLTSRCHTQTRHASDHKSSNSFSSPLPRAPSRTSCRRALSAAAPLFAQTAAGAYEPAHAPPPPWPRRAAFYSLSLSPLPPLLLLSSQSASLRRCAHDLLMTWLQRNCTRSGGKAAASATAVSPWPSRLWWPGPSLHGWASQQM